MIYKIFLITQFYKNDNLMLKTGYILKHCLVVEYIIFKYF